MRRAKQTTQVATSEMAVRHQPRKRVGTFTTLYPAVCASCHEEITVGSTAHYGSGGQIVHHRHQRPEAPPTICGICHLTKPCECDA